MRFSSIFFLFVFGFCIICHVHSVVFAPSHKTNPKQNKNTHIKPTSAFRLRFNECNELTRLCINFIFILIINTNLMKFNNILVYCRVLWFQRPNGMLFGYVKVRQEGTMFLPYHFYSYSIQWFFVFTFRIFFWWFCSYF